MNYESLTGHTCSGCSPELLDRYLEGNLLAHAIRVDIPQSMEPRSPEPLVHGLQDRADDREIGPPSEHPDGEAVAKRKE